MLKDKEDCNLLIIKFLYKLSLDYPFMKTDFKINGVGNINSHVNLYGDIHQDAQLESNIKSLEAMMRDKPKKFKFGSTIAPISYAKSAGPVQELDYVFNMYRQELRGDKLNNLLDDE